MFDGVRRWADSPAEVPPASRRFDHFDDER
jgi:hypothetical protein